ncbi:hypothetical protein [Virgibacillus siamensis]|uniref:hypothetical protein n=1 Tax=Virgibacillus siamensis TaxID=480071 RepID=UPI00158E8620|nr:hypothetical protein [Virgibacillus siamensis]
MHSQRAGVAGSPEVHDVLTSSLSAVLNGNLIPIRCCRVFHGIPVIKKGWLTAW